MTNANIPCCLPLQSLNPVWNEEFIFVVCRHSFHSCKLFRLITNKLTSKLVNCSISVNGKRVMNARIDVKWHVVNFYHR